MASNVTRSASADVTLGQAFAASKNYNTSLLKKFIRQQLQVAAQLELDRLTGSSKRLKDADIVQYSALPSQSERDEFVQVLAKRSVAKLLSQPDEDHEPEKRATLLHWASYSGSLESMQLLMAFGADINAVEADGKTPLHWSAFEGHEDICRYLLNNPKELKPYGTTVDYMLLAADVNGDRVHTPCHLAVINHHMSVAELFPNYLDVIAKDNRPANPVEIIIDANTRPAVEHEMTRLPSPPPPPPPRATSEMGVATSPVPSRSSSSGSDRAERELRRKRREEKREKKRRRQREKEEMLRQLIAAINEATLAKEQLQQQIVVQPPAPPRFIPASPIRIRWVPQETDDDTLIVIPAARGNQLGSQTGGLDEQDGTDQHKRLSKSPTSRLRGKSPSRGTGSGNGYFLRTTSPTAGSAGRAPWRPPSNVRIDTDVRVIGHGPLVTEAQISLSQARATAHVRRAASPTLFLRSDTQNF